LKTKTKKKEILKRVQDDRIKTKKKKKMKAKDEILKQDLA